MQIRNFCLRSNLRNDDNIYCLKASAGLKTGVENDIFRSSEDMGSRGTPPPRIPPREVEVPVSDRI